MYAGVQPSNHALEIVQECKHCTTTENKRMKYFSFVPSIFNEMVTSYLHRSTESMFMTENEFFASFPFFVTYDIRTVKKKFCEKIYRRKEPWSEERSMCSFLASRFQILLHLIMSAYLSDCFGQKTFNKIWLSWHLVLLQLRVILAGESTAVIAVIVWCIILWWCCVSSLHFFCCLANVVAINVKYIAFLRGT